MNTLIDDIEEYVNLEKSIIARIGKEESQKIINGIKELLELKEKLDNIFIDYTFYLKQDLNADFRHISLEISNVEISGIGESVIRFIVNYELKNSYLYWIDTMTDSLKLRYTIKYNHNGDDK